jgi:glucosyl-3-phosphoglycerate synthase
MMVFAMKRDWIQTNTFHFAEFGNLRALVDIKEKKGIKISLCLPTLNEENTIAKEIVILKSELMTRYALLDEIVVIDSGSTDHTKEIAACFGADVYDADDILPHLPKFKGKGENLWKALYITSGDIIIYLDADIKNIHHRFVYGLIGPLLFYDEVKYSKAFYDRPLTIGVNKIRPSGGGRVTELVIRPLFSIFYPDLAQIIQPLSGEYAAYRNVLDKIPFPIGYGIETSMIIDIYQKWGINVIAQVDLEKRVHRNQDTIALGKMAFAIMKTFILRQIQSGLFDINTEMFDEMIQYNLVEDQFTADMTRIEGDERPPMIKIPEYRKKFQIPHAL